MSIYNNVIIVVVVVIVIIVVNFMMVVVVAVAVDGVCVDVVGFEISFVRLKHDQSIARIKPFFIIFRQATVFESRRRRG